MLMFLTGLSNYLKLEIINIDVMQKCENDDVKIFTNLQSCSSSNYKALVLKLLVCKFVLVFI